MLLLEMIRFCVQGCSGVRRVPLALYGLDEQLHGCDYNNNKPVVAWRDMFGEGYRVRMGEGPTCLVHACASRNGQPRLCGVDACLACRCSPVSCTWSGGTDQE